MGDLLILQNAASSIDEEIALIGYALEREALFIQLIRQEGRSAHIDPLLEAHEVLRDRFVALICGIAAQRHLNYPGGGANG